MLRYGRFEPPERRQPQVVDDYTKWFLARLRTLEPLLAQQAFLCAGRFTPAVQAYWQRLRERDGFQRAMRAQALAAQQQGVPATPAPSVPAPP